MTKKLLPIHPGNTYPNHDNLVAVVVRTENGQLLLTRDYRLGRQSWRCWSDVIAWQELPEVTEITKTEHDVKVIHYTWKCPGCDYAMDWSEKPEHDDDLLCYSCMLEDKKQKWHAENAFLLNSTITDLQWTNGMGFRGMIVCDANGNKWAITGSMTCEEVTK